MVLMVSLLDPSTHGQLPINCKFSWVPKFGRPVRTQIGDVFKICWHHAPLAVKEKIKGALPELQKMFTSLDADGSGHVTRAEAANVPLTVSYLQQICLICFIVG